MSKKASVGAIEATTRSSESKVTKMDSSSADQKPFFRCESCRNQISLLSHQSTGTTPSARMHNTNVQCTCGGNAGSVKKPVRKSGAGGMEGDSGKNTEDWSYFDAKLAEAEDELDCVARVIEAAGAANMFKDMHDPTYYLRQIWVNACKELKNGRGMSYSPATLITKWVNMVREVRILDTRRDTFAQLTDEHLPAWAVKTRNIIKHTPAAAAPADNNLESTELTRLGVSRGRVVDAEIMKSHFLKQVASVYLALPDNERNRHAITTQALTQCKDLFGVAASYSIMFVIPKWYNEFMQSIKGDTNYVDDTKPAGATSAKTSSSSATPVTKLVSNKQTNLNTPLNKLNSNGKITKKQTKSPRTLSVPKKRENSESSYSGPESVPRERTSKRIRRTPKHLLDKDFVLTSPIADTNTQSNNQPTEHSDSDAEADVQHEHTATEPKSVLDPKQSASTQNSVGGEDKKMDMDMSIEEPDSPSHCLEAPSTPAVQLLVTGRRHTRPPARHIEFYQHGVASIKRARKQKTAENTNESPESQSTSTPSQSPPEVNPSKSGDQLDTTKDKQKTQTLPLDEPLANHNQPADAPPKCTAAANKQGTDEAGTIGNGPQTPTPNAGNRPAQTAGARQCTLDKDQSTDAHSQHAQNTATMATTKDGNASLKKRAKKEVTPVSSTTTSELDKRVTDESKSVPLTTDKDNEQLVSQSSVSDKSVVQASTAQIVNMNQATNQRNELNGLTNEHSELIAPTNQEDGLPGAGSERRTRKRLVQTAGSSEQHTPTVKRGRRSKTQSTTPNANGNAHMVHTSPVSVQIHEHNIQINPTTANTLSQIQKVNASVPSASVAQAGCSTNQVAASVPVTRSHTDGSVAAVNAGAVQMQNDIEPDIHMQSAVVVIDALPATSTSTPHTHTNTATSTVTTAVTRPTKRKPRKNTLQIKYKKKSKGSAATRAQAETESTSNHTENADLVNETEPAQYPPEHLQYLKDETKTAFDDWMMDVDDEGRACRVLASVIHVARLGYERLAQVKTALNQLHLQTNTVNAAENSAENSFDADAE